MKRGRSLFKYYGERQWAEALHEGELLFRSLAYFRDLEDEETRGDRNEGAAVHRPAGGLVINNQTQGKTMTLPNYSFVSRAAQAEIFVFCLSRSMTEERQRRFKATACVEVLDIPKFCGRVQAALPSTATFPGLPGHMRIGQRVTYYTEQSAPTPRWALPDLIATSKLAGFAWQDEFRLVFSLTDALAFQNVKLTLEEQPDTGPDPADHRSYLVKAGGLADIYRIRDL